MIHVGFTVQGNQAHIIIKDNDTRIIHQECLALGDIIGIMAEWLACKAALRQAARLANGAVRLYSDCGIIEQLASLTPEYKINDPCRWPAGYGPLPECPSKELHHFYDCIGLLWMTWRSRWEALKIEQRRILS